MIGFAEGLVTAVVLGGTVAVVETAGAFESGFETDECVVSDKLTVTHPCPEAYA